MNKKILLYLGTLTLIPFWAVPLWAKTSACPCEIQAIVADKDPKGLNVHKQPDGRSPIVAKIPKAAYGTIVTITQTRGSWARLSEATDADTSATQPLSGWVYLPLLCTGVAGDGNLYERPDPQSRVIGQIPSNVGESPNLIRCQEGWVLVKYRKLTGWLSPDDQCPNPLTTCP
jgi:SH3-like domain-containing protein